MDCFQSQSTVDICIAGLNRRAGYATGCIRCVTWKLIFCWNMIGSGHAKEMHCCSCDICSSDTDKHSSLPSNESITFDGVALRLLYFSRKNFRVPT